MAVRVQCPGCETAFQAADQLEGTRARCANCGGPIDVPIPFDDPSEEDKQLPLLSEPYTGGPGGAPDGAGAASQGTSPFAASAPIHPSGEPVRAKKTGGAGWLWLTWLVLTVLLAAVFVVGTGQIISGIGIGLAGVSGVAYSFLKVGFLPERFRKRGMPMMTLTGAVGVLLLIIAHRVLNEHEKPEFKGLFPQKQQAENK